MCLGEEERGAPATLHSPGTSTGGPLPPVTEEQLMNSGHELHERYTCPLCCLPISLPLGKHSKFMPCCMKRVCNGCVLALHRRGMGESCPFCRAPTSDNDAVIALIQKRVDVGDPMATEFLAQFYYSGNNGLEMDIPRAIELWTEAANLGNLGPHFWLGFFYCKGKCVDKDVGRGVRHWQHAAIQGDPESRLMLGAHEHGNGNNKLAVRHWMISVKMGCEKSLNAIKDKFMKGHATKAQYAEALRGYQNALEETKSPQREEAEARRHVKARPRRPVARTDRPLRDRQQIQHGEPPALIDGAAVLLPPAILLEPGTAHLPVPRGPQPPEDRSPAPRDGAAAPFQPGEGEAAPASNIHGKGSEEPAPRSSSTLPVVESLELVRREERPPPQRRYDTLTDPLDCRVVPRRRRAAALAPSAAVGPQRGFNPSTDTKARQLQANPFPNPGYP
ncbi:hypothetical protein THAOC_37774 [Thalassiosira oceanica]|uniref:RING-type domain-containing protein n=1 Tax=Thalassiosira oceanica TaxID=159749 RepID=K0RBB9_THAOC|nr:hypothetical protein THAOC_37774 [Thalassiosira oceanica]|eukprot:EJK43752.1 hypothetical protein THAOC_37774 [Thalassiosira oceanica]